MTIFKRFVAAIFCLCLLQSSLTVFAMANDDINLTNRFGKIYDIDNLLGISEANTVHQTSEGYIWVGSYAGLFRYNGTVYELVSGTQSGLPAEGIRELYEATNGVLYIGTNDSGVFRYMNHKFEPCEAAGSNKYRSVRDFAEASDGTIYVATSTGVAVLRSDGILEGIEVSQISGKSVDDISIDENGILWGACTTGELFAIKDNELVYWFELDNPHGAQYTAVSAFENTIWIGTNINHIIKLTLLDDQYTTQSYNFEHIVADGINDINLIYRTSNHEYWIASDGGAGWFDRNMQFHLVEEFMENTFIQDICEDYEGNIWLASSKGGVLQLIHGTFSNANLHSKLNGQSIHS